MINKHSIHFIALVTLVAAVGFVSSCSKDEEARTGAAAGASPKTAPKASATRVEIAVLQESATAGRMVRPGEVQGSREADLGAALGGYVERVAVRSGQDVKKGAIIARVDTSTHSAQLNLVKVEQKDAARELERVRKLGKTVAGSRLDAAATRVARADAQLRLSQTQLGRATIKAPFAGTIVGLELEQGEIAAPGQVVARLLVLDPLLISVSVTDGDVGLLKEGQAAVVRTAGGATPIAGKLRRIEPAANLKTRTFLVEVEVANPDRKLLPGMIASVEFGLESNTDRMLLPQDFLVTALDENGVFVVDEASNAKWRPLQLGQIVGNHVEVLSGLSRGEMLVTVGMRQLSDGDPVIAVREGICCREGKVFFQHADTQKAKASPVSATAEDEGGAAK